MSETFLTIDTIIFFWYKETTGMSEACRFAQELGSRKAPLRSAQA